MWVLGKVALLVVMALSGLLLLVSSLPWLSYLLHDAPLPTRRLGELAAATLGSAAILGSAIWLYWLLDRYRQRTREQRRQAHAAARLDAIQRDAVFEARGSRLWPLLLLPLLAVFGFGTVAAAKDGRWDIAAISLAMSLLLLLAGWQLLHQLLRPGPLLRMDATAIDHALYGPIPWTDVIGIQLQSMQTRAGATHTLMLGVRGAKRYLDNASAPARWLYGRKRHGSGDIGTLTIPLGPLAEDPELIQQTARAFRERAAAPFLPFWYDQMGAHEIDTALSMQALTDEMAAMPSLRRDATPAQIAAFEARGHSLLERQQALLPELGAVAQTHLQQARRSTLRLRIAMWLVIVAMVISLALKVLSRL